MDDMIAPLGRRGSQQIGMQRGLAIVDLPLRHQRKDIVRIKEGGVSARGWYIAPAKSKNLPGPLPEVALARHRRECRLNILIFYAKTRHDLLGVATSYGG